MVHAKQTKITAEFKQEALRILSTSGRTVAEVAADLGLGKSTLQRWKTHATETELLSGPHRQVEKELARLRHENKILRQERDLLKNAAAFFAGRQVDDLPAHRREEGRNTGWSELSFIGREQFWLLCLEAAKAQSSAIC